MKSKPAKINVGVLFLVFNRLDTTKKVFEEIKKAKPSRLFIASDGPRENKPEEKKIVQEVRKYILDNIDWDCEVKTLFRKKNIGCKYAVSGAIDWFFENVEQGIILEDDCLPSQSFFRFCSEMLDKYKGDKRVMSISGTNFLEDKTKNLKKSYYFSGFVHIWGWATWKRAWEKYDLEIHKKMDRKNIKQISSGFLNYLQNLKRINDLKKEKVNTWDYQWKFSIKINNGLVVIPKKNLVENIGLIQKEYTNARPNKIDLKYLYKRRNNLNFPLKHPKLIKNVSHLDRKFILNELKRGFLKKYG